MPDRPLLVTWLVFSVVVAWLPLPWLLRALLVAAAGAVAWWWLRRPASAAVDEPAAPTAVAPRLFDGDPGRRLASRFLLGDVFSAVGADGLLEWDAQPRAGRRVRFLVACDGSAAPRAASARAAAYADGPFAEGQPLEAAIGGFEFETGEAPHASVDIVLPDTAGWYWLHLDLDDHRYGPLRIEVADAARLDARRAAFAAADAALLESGDPGPWLVAGLYAPRPADELRMLLADGEAFAGSSGAAWALLATRVDVDGVLQPQPGRPLNRLILVDDRADGRATLHDDFALAAWTLYSWPQAAPRGGYAGWWWKRDGLPAGGLCGTAWCQYPFPGNVPRDWRPAMMIATPPPPDPLDWWLARRGGWICGNGWWQGRETLGGSRFGPWWPRDGDGLPAPDGEPRSPDDDPPPPPPPPVPPGQTRTRRRPPGQQPPPEATACAADFVEAVSKYTYGKPPYGRRVRPGNGVRGIARYDRLPSYTVPLRWVRMVDNWTASGGYTRAWSTDPDEVGAELRRNREWWAQYCIAVTERELVLPDTDELRRLAEEYRAWLDALPQPPPGVMMGLGDAMTGRGLALYESTKNAVRAALRADPGPGVVVVFMPRVVGSAGHTGENRRRPTEASFTVPDAPIVMLNQLDADDEYILAHELIHAWGRPSSLYTWDHQSGHPRAMSRILREHIKQAAGLDASRLLDYAEYDEILSSGQLRPVGR